MTMDTLLTHICASLQNVPGLQAVVLGGSRARGTAHTHSDIDIGLYYAPGALDLDALNRAASDLDEAHRSCLIGAPGSWGHWVNAGGWLEIAGYPVDLILRDVTRVEKAIADTDAGRVSIYYQVGHPHGFLNVMYRGELAICRMLWDRDGHMTRLKQAAEQYPEPLRRSIVGTFSFEADFSLANAAKGPAADHYYRAAQILRALSCIHQVLFALAGAYCLNEKGAVALLESFEHTPDAYGAKVQRILTHLGETPDRALLLTQELLREIHRLTARVLSSHP